MISDHTEGTLGRLRYFLGGGRPSQTTRLTLSLRPSRVEVRINADQEWYPKGGSTEADAPASKPPTYPVHDPHLLNIKL